MARLTNKGYTARAPQTGSSVPELPDFSQELAELPGGQQTNAALQRWWDLVRQRIEFNNGSLDGRLQQFSRTIGGITGSITVLEEITSNVEDYLESRYTINVSAGPIVTGMTIFSSTGPDENVSYVAFQADRFLVNTSGGGNKQLFSASAAAVKLGDVFTVDLASAKVYVGTGTYANANTYWYVDTVSGGRMSLGSKFVWDGSTLTLDGSITATSGSIGGWTINSTTISRNNAILDSAGQLVLGTSNDVVYISATDSTYRIWIGNVTAGSAAFRVTKTGVLTATGATITGSITATSGTIGGWSIASTTISSNNAVLDSAGQLALGTSNNIIYISATDATYRIWAGNVTAGSASFSVTKAGALFSNSGTIGGFTIGATTLTAGSGSTAIKLDVSVPLILFGGIATTFASYRIDGVLTGDASANLTVDLYNHPGGYGFFRLLNAGTVKFTVDASTGALTLVGTATATLFSGSGASLTSLNASNISSGTLSNSRLPAAISVTSLGLSSTSTGALTMNGSGASFEMTDGTVNVRYGINHATARMTWGTTTNHSIEIYTNNALTWFFGSDGNFKSNGGDIRKVSSDNWSPKLFDGSATLEFQASGGQIYGRINGGSAILLG